MADLLTSLGSYCLLSPIYSRGDASALATRVEDPEGRVFLLDCRITAGDPSLPRGWAEEASIAVRVRHPHLRPLVEVFFASQEDHDFLVAVYERVPAVSMARLLRATGPTPLPVAMGLAVGVLEALRAVHEQRDDEGNPLGLFFREISPLNVLLSLDGRALLSDLAGLRVITSERLWASPRVNLRGFYLYESPELLQGQPRAVRDDLWSAAMILWTLISGVPVFLRDSDFASLHDLMTGKRRLFAELGPNLPPPLIATLERALHHDPARRHATAAELLDDLRASAPVAVASEIAAWALSHGAARLEESEPRRPGAPRPEPDDEGEALGYRSAPQARAPAAPRVPHRPASSPVSPSRWRRWWRWGRRS